MFILTALCLAKSNIWNLKSSNMHDQSDCRIFNLTISLKQNDEKA